MTTPDERERAEFEKLREKAKGDLWHEQRYGDITILQAIGEAFNKGAAAARREERQRCAGIAQAKFDQIDGGAQMYSLTHHDEKSFALNQQRLGALAILRALSVLDSEEK